VPVDRAGIAVAVEASGPPGGSVAVVGDEQQERTSGDDPGADAGDPVVPTGASAGGGDVGRDGVHEAGEEPGGHGLPDEVEYPVPAASGLPPRLERWRKRSATGAMLTGFAFGLREVLEPERHEPAIVLETSGVPPKDLPVEADLDSGPPRQSVVRIRRWLLSDEAVPASEAGAAPATGESGAAGTGDEPGVAPALSTGIRDRDPKLKHRSRRMFRAGRRS
jgi:hypothetical protein